ncbi:S-methyl-5-thioribose-1-phosphate isomerase [Coemansia sp. RSA 1935]|nr:S-methyl-5-thioribose-1-phosphate isomerase [Coemansia sp. RSA 1935]KAJ2587653.1 S-methyl-5-thioribose-1-phosphate isomerase [Coemansia sp. RSA 1797]
MSARLQAIKWERPHLTILNQLALPHSSEYIEISDARAGHYAISSMQTRGAPAIAIVAALSLAAELSTMHFDTSASARTHIHMQLDYLATSRPTAVNLFDAITKLKHAVDTTITDNGQVVRDTYVQMAERMLDADVKDNMAIGEHGAQLIGNDKVRVLTHCNTGTLATAGYGTALGIVRSLHAQGSLDRVYFTETRPYNQGARLTAYELLTEEIPAQLVCDSAVSALLRSDPMIRAIIVGADRVAANGDTANKIGTYQLAITARYHGCQFIVAAPTTSVDLHTKSGADIVIEERDEAEILVQTGFERQGVLEGRLERVEVQVAPVGTRAWNPSFDVTPAELISAIVTERGVVVKQPGASEFDMAGHMRGE